MKRKTLQASNLPMPELPPLKKVQTPYGTFERPMTKQEQFVDKVKKRIEPHKKNRLIK